MSLFVKLFHAPEYIAQPQGMLGLKKRIALLAVLILGLIGPALLVAQTEEVDEMKLIQKVAELQQQLEADEITKRDEAEKALLEMGVFVLDHLEPTNDKTPSDAVERVGRVRQKLETLAVKLVTQPTKLTLKGSLTLKDAFDMIKQQTGNQVSLYENAPDELLAKKADFNISDGSFWDAIEQVKKQTSMSYDPFQSERGIFRLVPQQALETGKKPVEIPKDVSGIFEVAVTRVSAVKNLAQPDLDYYNVGLRLRWEPRITPISIDLPAASIKIKDEFDGEVKVSNQEAVFSGTVNPEIPELEFSVNLKSIDRQVESLKSLTAELNTVLPGRIEKFKFPNIGRMEIGSSQTKAGVIVGFEGVKKNEDLFGVLVSVKFDNPEKGLESHLSWIFENKMWLTDKDGNVVEPLATESFSRQEDKITIQYFFDQDPSALALRYETPAAIVAVPIKISLKGIPLP